MAGLLCAGNGARPKPGESDRWRDGSGNGSGCRGVVSPISGVIVRGSIWCAGACAVMSGVIVDSRGISGPAPGALIHSCSLVLVLVLVVVVVVVVDVTICAADMVRRYAPPIWCDDMVNRYARPENRKGQERVAPGP